MKDPARAYDRLARQYDRRWRRYLEETLGRVVGRTESDPGGLVLDVGCGTGELLRRLQPSCPHARLVGVDASWGMLSRAGPKPADGSKPVASASGSRTTASWPVALLQAKAEALPFRDRAFHRILCANSLHGFYEARQAIREIARLLKPDGTLLLVDWARDSWLCSLVNRWCRWFDPTHVWMYSTREVRQMLQQAGLSVQRVDRFRVPWPGPLRLWGMMAVLSVNTVEAAADPPLPVRHSNRLAHEKSPYLLQHADNPVDWYPWGREAFERARQEDKPVFLSIGYSTCHWCHVMEEESFEDPSVAALLNQHFVSIKVDREERPDVDSLYMQAVIQMTGQGGWPLSAFLTPAGKPFYGGTYFPPEDRWGQPGFKSVLRGVAQAWQDRREEILRSGEALTQALQAEGALAAAGKGSLTEETLSQAFQLLSSSYDEAHGGFLPAPKFPRPHALSLLLRIWKRTGDADALRMVEETLRAMAAGGIHDHLGGGFHRYSTDAQWFLPHFEKMLYDQALLAIAYLEAFQATGDGKAEARGEASSSRSHDSELTSGSASSSRSHEYAQIARGILDYVLRDMTSPEGGFTSAEDADSTVPGTGAVPGTEKKEGAFYVWTAEELKALLGEQRYAAFAWAYGIEPGGNVRSDPQGEFKGRNILALRPGGAPMDEATRQILFQARSRLPRPHLDNKILTDWNGLMISALALGARVLEEPRYAQAAQKAADFLLDRMVRPDGRLLHRYREGEAGILGTLEDYAFLAHGLFDLYQATFEVSYLAQAKRLAEQMIRLFWDEHNGGFFLTGSDAEALLVRQKEIYDGAIPAGNSVAALVLLRVGRLTVEQAFEAKARQLLEGFSGLVRQHPTGYPQLLIALDFALGPSREIVLAGDPNDPAMPAMIQAVYRRFLPNKVIALHPPGKAGEEIEGLAPFLKGQTALQGKPTAYACRNYACDLPANTPQKLAELLDR